ncbi:MAG: pyruvate, phosphate dikinase [Alphaproteobacteria bacterium]|nr:pyruvate, phosphate dikinase [Alphaproteobacteria bacterium]
MTHVYSFDIGNGKNKMLLGGKGANLCEMTQIGLNVPPGFVISTEACLAYNATKDKSLPAGVMDDVRKEIIAVEKKTGRGFGDAKNPLLVSVRSGAAMSMPGMMDTILNLGLNEQTLKGLIEQSGNPRFGWDAYRRFIQLFGKVALGINDAKFDEDFEEIKRNAGVKADVGLKAEHLEEAAKRFLATVQAETGKPFPNDPYEQLEIAIKAVFNSWMGRRAVDYRREFHITPKMANGTAVNVQTMVFGNLGDDSATGVAFTRYPDTGENKLYGEYLVNAQGEDVVAGIRTPKPVDEMAKEMPDLFRQLVELRNKLESHYKEVQDFEFTIEKGTLYCLQTRNGKMNAAATVRTSVEMVAEGLLSKGDALMRVAPESLEQLLFPQIDRKSGAKAVAVGLPASPGAAVGIAVFDADRAAQLGRGEGKKVILVREETKPEDIHGFFASEGILTSRGGKTSHAAVVARGMGKACVAGAEGIEVNVQKRHAVIGSHVIEEGDTITINGTTGEVYLGQVPMIEAKFTNELSTLLSWADAEARIKVFANADTPPDAQKARGYGAVGIGLCRTERMFNAKERLPVVVEMIVSETVEDRKAALAKLLPMQREDFKGIFKAMSPYPVTIRLLDPPMHEFLPAEFQLMDEISQLSHLRETLSGMEVLSEAVNVLYTGQDKTPVVPGLAAPQLVDQALKRKQTILKMVRNLHEVNPMLGHRGVRLGISHPEIYEMQIRGILEATAECQKEGIEVHPEIMVPQVGEVKELDAIKKVTLTLQAEIEAQYGVKLDYKFGSMIEVVRACLLADELAEVAEFFSFGTNDLTQAAFSYSREDAENKFLPLYIEKGVLESNPFEALDQAGVGKLMDIAVKLARGKKDGIKVGICGEHGGHPASIEFVDKIGLTYASCSAPRVPIARLAAAQSKLRETSTKGAAAMASA